MSALEARNIGTVNGIDVDALHEVIEEVKKDPSKALVEFKVKTGWKGQTRSETAVDSYKLGGKEIKRRFTINADEPIELLGENTSANPQELLMAALNACITVGYVAGAAVNGITLRKLEIETSGRLDLRGFLGLDSKVKPGYESLQYVVRIAGNGTAEQFKEIHENVMKTSPNYFNLSQPVKLDAKLELEN
ncbi:MAG TPA: OsmC family protein [Candidatus Binatia bacterium]|nr:OsmC family protein [Candidatus Binatia bacterium]